MQEGKKREPACSRGSGPSQAFDAAGSSKLAHMSDQKCKGEF
jgi:hypothetical protein